MQYTEDPNRHVPHGRVKLTAVVRAAGDIIHIDDAARALDLPRSEAAKLLARWASQAWLRRVGRGAYVAVPLDLLESELVLDDPWVLVPALFAPAYIGGWSAAEHWDLTEQIFRDIMVLTAQSVRQKTQHHHGADFVLKHIRKDKIFGAKSVWRGRTKIPVSDTHRTIIDMLDDPALGGGIQHVADCLHAYLHRGDRDEAKLIAYGDRLGNGAVFKRLGFLAERDPNGEALIVPCRERLTAGNAKLDPALICPRIVSKWRLCVPESWLGGRAPRKPPASQARGGHG
jgi:predicted transcriptional regulator of viral defense system